MADEREELEKKPAAEAGQAPEASEPSAPVGGSPPAAGSRAADVPPPGVGGAAAPAEKLQRAREVVAELSGLLGVEAQVQVRDEEEAIGCMIEVQRGGEIFETGPRGQVLEALAFLANRIVNREGDDRKRIAVEVGAFPETGNDPAMEEMARRLAEAARRIAKPLTIVPMAARDRRVVHQVAGEADGVGTRSEGDGVLRRLIVEFKEEDAATEEG